MKIELDSTDESLPITLTQREAGPGLPLPVLQSVSTIQRPLSIPGIEAAPTNNVRAECDNTDGALSMLWADRPPVRKPARVIVGSSVVFAGVVTGVDLGATATILMESGLDRPFSDALPLRTSAVWGGWRNVQVLPWGWGTVTIEPIQYSDDQRVFLLLDHPAAGVDSVRRDDVETVAYEFSNQLDSTGRAVAFLELAEPLSEGERLSVTMRGRMHPDTGAVIASPAGILHDLLNNLAGAAIPWPEFDEFRAETEGMQLGGLLTDNSVTVRGAVDTIVQSIGGAWAAAMPGVAMLWPAQADPAAPALLIDPQTAVGVSASTDATGLFTALRVLFDWDDAAQRFRKAVQMEAPAEIKNYGRLETEWQAPWLRSPRDAEALGRRVLGQLARPRWRVTWDVDFADVATGAWVDVQHPQSPLSGRHRLVSAELNTARPQVACAIEAAVGAAPEIELARLSEAYDPLIQPGIAVEIGRDEIIFTARGDDGEPLAGAHITLDGKETRISDGRGRVSFPTQRGRHTLIVEAVGYPAFETEVVV